MATSQEKREATLAKVTLATTDPNQPNDAEEWRFARNPEAPSDHQSFLAGWGTADHGAPLDIEIEKSCDHHSIAHTTWVKTEEVQIFQPHASSTPSRARMASTSTFLCLHPQKRDNTSGRIPKIEQLEKHMEERKGVSPLTLLHRKKGLPQLRSSSHNQTV
ncbi:hypothetical protein [Aquipseudomonas alcaligenes]|uniref:hypothetical protein n=1 Tax=Aquipseudomonas alcaligenes TaxID=43263 RepID=UPI0011B818D6|nr:hypothetical protein [Pseudomonas alcaligenes]